MRWSVIWIAVVFVLSCGDSESSSSGGRKRDRDDDRKDKGMSCEDAVDNVTRDKDRKADLVSRCIRHEWSRRMKKCVSQAESRSDVRACEREHDTDRTSVMWDKMDAYADKICACHDMDCITKAGEQWAKDAAELAKDSAGRASEMTDEDKRKSEQVTRKITDCTKKVTDEMMRRAAGSDGIGW